MLFDVLTDFGNLYKAHKKCKKGTIWKDSVAQYELRCLESTVYLRGLLITGRYKISGYNEFTINERGKIRRIRATKYQDRVVQKSLIDNILNPIMLPKLITDNGASQEGKGTDFARKRLEKHIRDYLNKNGTTGYAIIGDFKGYFDSIPHDKLNETYARYIDDARIIKLIKDIHASTPGDKGVPLGNQLSQLDALIIASRIDHMVKEGYRIKWYGRYMDDFYILSNDKAFLKKVLDSINRMAESLGLKLNTEKTKIVPLSQGFNFLGYKHFVNNNGRYVRLLLRKKKARERQKIKKHLKKVQEGVMTYQDALDSYRAFRSSNDKGDTFYVLQEMDLYFYGTFEEYLDGKEKTYLKKLRKKHQIRMNKRKERTRHVKTTKQPAGESSCQVREHKVQR